MALIFTEENNRYQLDASAAIWASDQLRDIFHQAKIELSDVDFVLQPTEDSLLLVEYKNANIQGAAHSEAFNPNDDKSKSKIARKYYDSCFYLNATGHNLAKTYIYIVEYPNGDSTTRKMLRNKIKNKLPFKLQEIAVTESMIQGFDVLSIAEWNAHAEYSKFPLSEVTP